MAIELWGTFQVWERVLVNGQTTGGLFFPVCNQAAAHSGQINE